jgi:hypothetical protein
MKIISRTLLLILLLFGALPIMADRLTIAPCDEAVINIFGDLICLSQDEGILRRYVNGNMASIFLSQDIKGKLTLQDPLRPILDGADNIYMLDAATNTIISWDRFLNIHSVTPLHENIISPVDFTVTSEHDWLIYDDFYGQILQVHSGNGFFTDWGDKPVSGDIKLYTVDNLVIIHLEDKNQVRVCDENGTSLNEFLLPQTLKVNKVFPLENLSFALRTESGIFIWKPKNNLLRYLTDLDNVIHVSHYQDNHYLLISQDGEVLTIP